MTKRKGKAPSGQIAVNRKARHDYLIDETLEVGISLTGTEVKSARAGNVNLRDGYVVSRDGELWLTDVHIAPYEQGNRENHDPRRERKLLAHRREIAQWTAKSRERGITIVPLRMYWSRNHIKVEIALARGKRQYDKRASIAKRESERRIQRALKEQLR
jgi:SsrA-binding protein